jgi:hypothetical protein
MAPVEIATLGLSARDIATYSDAELNKYLEDNGRLGRFLDVTLYCRTNINFQVHRRRRSRELAG